MGNQPYVKQFKDGVLINPITVRYNSGKSLRKLKRKLERYLTFDTLVNKENKPLIFHQLKTKRGKWNTVNILNKN